MAKEIILSDEKRKELIRTFKTSRQTVWAALNYKTKSGFANTLRAAALQRGGAVIEVQDDKVTRLQDSEVASVDEPLVYFREVPKQMVFDYGECGVKLVIDLCEGGNANIERNGNMLRSFVQPKLSDIEWMKAETVRIINSL